MPEVSLLGGERNSTWNASATILMTDRIMIKVFFKNLNQNKVPVLLLRWFGVLYNLG